MPKEPFPKQITNGEKYGPAMEITDPTEAREYLEACIQHCMTRGESRESATAIELNNLGYYAGYYSDEVRERVERLFRCSHPILGKIKQATAQ